MSLTDVLTQTLQIKGVTSAAVMNGTGRLVESIPESGMEVSFVGGLIASSLAVSRVLAELLGEGEVTQTMIEYERGPVLLAPLQPQGYTAVLTLQDSQSLGRVRWQLRKLLPEMAAALTARASQGDFLRSSHGETR